MPCFGKGGLNSACCLGFPPQNPAARRGHCAAQLQLPQLLPPCQELAKSASLARVELMDLGFSLVGWRMGTSGVMLRADKHGEMSGEAPFPQLLFAKAGGTFQTPLLCQTSSCQQPGM